MESLDHGEGSFGTPVSLVGSLYGHDADLVDDANTMTYHDVRSHQRHLTADEAMTLTAEEYEDAEAGVSDKCGVSTDSERWSGNGHLPVAEVQGLMNRRPDSDRTGYNPQGGSFGGKDSRTPSPWCAAKEAHARSSPQGGFLMGDAAGDGDDITSASECGVVRSIPLSSEARSSASRPLEDAFMDAVGPADALEEYGVEAPMRGGVPLGKVEAVASEAPDQMSEASYALLERARANQNGWFLNPEEMTTVSSPGARWPYRLRSIPSSSLPSSRPSTQRVSVEDALVSGPLLTASPPPHRPVAVTCHPSGQRCGGPCSASSGHPDVCRGCPEGWQDDCSQGAITRSRQRAAHSRPLISPSVADDDSDVMARSASGACDGESSEAARAIPIGVARRLAPLSPYAYEMVQPREQMSTSSTTGCTEADACAMRSSKCIRGYDTAFHDTAAYHHSLQKGRRPPANVIWQGERPHALSHGGADAECRPPIRGTACAKQSTVSAAPRAVGALAEARSPGHGHLRRWKDEPAGSSPSIAYPMIADSDTSWGSLADNVYVEEEPIQSWECDLRLPREPALHTGGPPTLIHASVEPLEGPPSLGPRREDVRGGQPCRPSNFAARLTRMRQAWLSECELADRVDRGYQRVMRGPISPSIPQARERVRGGDGGGARARTRGAANAALLPSVLDALSGLLRTVPSSGRRRSATDGGGRAAAPCGASFRSLSSEYCRGFRTGLGVDGYCSPCESGQSSEYDEQATYQDQVLSDVLKSLTAAHVTRRSRYGDSYRPRREAESLHLTERAAELWCGSGFGDEATPRELLRLAYELCRLVAPHGRELLLLLMLMAEEEEERARRCGYGVRMAAGTVTLAMCAEAANRVLEKYSATQRVRATERLCAQVVVLGGHRARWRGSGHDGRVAYATFVSSVLELSRLGGE